MSNTLVAVGTAKWIINDRRLALRSVQYCWTFQTFSILDRRRKQSVKSLLISETCGKNRREKQFYLSSSCFTYY